jgi:hypothetical protein
MKPSQISKELRRIATTINNSKKPHLDLVIKDIRKVLASLSESGDPSSPGGYSVTCVMNSAEFKFSVDGMVSGQPISGDLEIKLGRDGQFDGWEYEADEGSQDISEGESLQTILDICMDELHQSMAKHLQL